MPDIVYSPASINELDSILSGISSTVTYLAGTTDLMVREKEWETIHAMVNLDSVREIRQTLEIKPEGILIGAAKPMGELLSEPQLIKQFPILAQAMSQVGSVQIQNRATLGGNIANASPAGDTLPPLSVIGAELWIGPAVRGKFKKIRPDQLMTGPGKTNLEPNQYIAYIFLPHNEENRRVWYLRKVGQRTALSISKVSLAVLGWIIDNRVHDIRICTGSVTPVIARAAKTESFLNGNVLKNEVIQRAVELIKQEVTPIDDIRSSSDYRREICGELLREALSITAKL